MPNVAAGKTTSANNAIARRPRPTCFYEQGTHPVGESQPSSNHRRRPNAEAITLVICDREARADSIRFACESSKTCYQPLNSGFAQQIVGVAQRKIFRNVFAASQAGLLLCFRQSCRPGFIKFIHIALRAWSWYRNLHRRMSPRRLGRWYHDRRIVPHLDPIVRILLKNQVSFPFYPRHTRRKESRMRTINRALRYSLPVIIACGIFLLINVTPLAQTKQLPAPTVHVNDFAGVLDAKTKDRIESLLENLKQRSQIDFYVATVESTGSQDIFDFSRQLARDWNIGNRASGAKTLLLVVSAGEKTSFTQFSKSVQNDLAEGVLGEVSQRMRSPLGEGKFSEAVDDGVLHFVNALGQKIGFSLQDIEKHVAVASTSASPETAVA